MKKSCEHKKHKLQKHQKEFEGEVFNYKAETCESCGAVLWNNALEKEYDGWIAELYKGKRHLFQVQYSITNPIQDCISKLLERFPHIEESLLIRAMIMVYIDIVENNERILTRLEEYIESEDYEVLSDGKKNQKKLQFSPSGFSLVLSYSRLFELRPNKIIEEVLKRMVLLSIKEDKAMKDFWENVVLKDIGRILNAA